MEPVSIDAKCFFAKLVGEQERDFDLILNGYVMGVDLMDMLVHILLVQCLML